MQVKTDFTDGLNSDVAPQKLPPNSYINLENLRLGTTDKGRTMQLESIGSTLEVNNPYLPDTGTNLPNGSCEDEARNRLIGFSYNSAGFHGIYCSDGTTVYKVLLDAQVTGGLGLSKDFFIHSANIVGDLLYWTDELNQPRRINIESGIKLNHPTYTTNQKAYVAPLAQENITLIRRAPQLPLECAKAVGADLGITVVQNFIKNLSLQFCYYYVFKDFETSVTSTRSLLFNYNFEVDTFDVISLKIPFLEKIQQDVYEIYLIAQNKESNKHFIIKKWGVYSSLDYGEIIAHNAGTTQLTYIFKGDYFGAALDDAFAAKPYESIPLLSRAQEVAKDRLFLGNNLIGYDSPIVTSLNISLAQGSGSAEPDQTVNWQNFNLMFGLTDPDGTTNTQNYDFKIFYLTGANPGFYSTAVGSYGPEVSTAVFGTLFFIGLTELDVYTYLLNYVYPGGDYSAITGLNHTLTSDAPAQITVTGMGIVVPITGVFFKTDSTYKVSVVFYDAFQRKCGVVEVPGIITVPSRKFTYDSYYTYIKWTLNNGINVLSEIPDWATHYQIVITQSKNINFFIEGVATKYAYVKKDTAGVYDYTGTVPGDNYTGLAIDLSELLNDNIGYTFQDKDLAALYMSGASTPVYTEVIGTDGKWVILNYKDIGTIASTPALLIYELRSPKVQGSEDLFYEVSQCYPVTNPGTGTRAYSVLTGNIRGDTYIVARVVGGTTYYLESVTPNSKHPLTWFTDAGRPNAVDRIGQKLIPNNIAFSNVNLQGTKNNGLSSFDALDTENVPYENGAINKLQLTSKTQDAGTIMLSICAGETTSIYLGEAQLVDQTGNAYVARAAGVLGTMNTLKGSFGTTNPESVVEHRGNVYWFDAHAGDFIFYSVNGVHSMTGQKTARFAKLYSDQYKSLTAAEIYALGNRPLIIGGVDVYHNEILWSLPKVGDNPHGTLVDTGNPYPYDFLDFQAKTVVFKLGAQGFMGAFTFNAEGFCSIGNKLYSFKDAKIYLHNQATRFNNFYGTDYKARVMFVVNAEPSMPKVLAGIAVESNYAPDYTHFRSEYPYEQSSDLIAGDYVIKEGIFYASALRDRLSPNATGDYNRKLSTGDRMRGTFIYQLLEFQRNAEIIQLKATNTSFVDSRGQKV